MLQNLLYRLCLILLFLLQIDGKIRKGKCAGGDCGLVGRCNAGKCGGLSGGCCPDQPIKCCDPSCPKCIGGKAPRPGSGCKAGCPLGGCCPGTCPCDDCICCYTITVNAVTVTSPCYQEEKTLITRTSTKTVTEVDNITETEIVPLTYTVSEIFLFTTTIELTAYAERPYYTVNTLSTESLLSRSTIYLSTSSVTELFTTRTAATITITTNAIISTTVFVSQVQFTSFIQTSLQSEIITTFETVVTGNVVQTFFDFVFTVPTSQTFTVVTSFSTTFDTIPILLTRTVPPITSPAITLGSSTITVIPSAITQNYPTSAFSTVPGDWTFYKYVTDTQDTLTIVTETSGFAVSTPVTQIQVLTETIPFTETINICPTRTKNLGTTTIYVRATDEITTFITTGSTIVYSTIASTLVFDPDLHH